MQDIRGCCSEELVFSVANSEYLYVIKSDVVRLLGELNGLYIYTSEQLRELELWLESEA